MTSDIQIYDDEVRNIGEQANTDAGLMQMIKFKKDGEVSTYQSDGREIPIGTRMIAHAVGWAKQWVHFVDQKPVERKTYRMRIKGEIAPERDQLPNRDMKDWPIMNGRPQDPWSLQYLLPLEDPQTGEVRIFVGSSFGARRAVGEVCSAYARRAAKKKSGQPIVELQKTTFPTRNFGEVVRPIFRIVDWDDSGVTQPVREISPTALTDGAAEREEINDEIPF